MVGRVYGWKGLWLEGAWKEGFMAFPEPVEGLMVFCRDELLPNMIWLCKSYWL
jgi:hypothetical protein